jgi:hypothetical protein
MGEKLPFRLCLASARYPLLPLPDFLEPYGSKAEGESRSPPPCLAAIMPSRPLPDFLEIF